MLAGGERLLVPQQRPALDEFIQIQRTGGPEAENDMAGTGVGIAPLGNPTVLSELRFTG